MPLTYTTVNEGSDVAAELVPPPPVPMQSSQGGGVGVGCAPPVSPGPAEANLNITHTSTSAGSKSLIELSPVVVVNTLSAGFAGRTPHDTPIDPASHALWRAYLAAGRLEFASDLCRERLLTEATKRARVCWVKDLAIVKRAGGGFLDAYDLHLSIAHDASAYGGSFRGRIENGFARSFETLGRYDEAFERYTAASHHAEGDGWLSANVDLNTGRCYTAAGRPDSSYFYFDRAGKIATQLSDSHLLGQIAESRALAFEAEGRFEEAEAEAWRSIQLLAPTGDRTATDESIGTWQRVKGKVRAR